MTKFYTMAISGATPDQEKRLAAEWQEHGWWHAVPGFWLFKDNTDQTTAAALRDVILKTAPAARVMIVEVAPITWAGSSMNDPNRDWLRSFWPPESS